ncbi:hypothetical protein [Psychromicrobium sp. YIM B11713]|uniref:hypothetical protein n=1 Tax=Psychromicrobium sp. YIM B11713 TaxID=3145233 RepID=UPI00374EF73C
MTFLIIIAALLVASLLGWPLTALVLKLARNVDLKAKATDETASESLPTAIPESEQAAQAEQTAGSAEIEKLAERPQPSQNSSKVLRGGLLIGVLERLAVVLCLVFDQPVAIAYVIAVKGLGRYPELKESPAASERFIIGTLASLIWATVVGVTARWLMSLL